MCRRPRAGAENGVLRGVCARPLNHQRPGPIHRPHRRSVGQCRDLASPHDARLRGRATPGQAARHQPAAAGRGTTGAGLDRRGDLEQPHVAGWICRRLRTCDRRTDGAHGPVQVLRLCARRAAGISGRSDQRPRRNGRPGARSGLPDRPPRTPGPPPALWSHPW